MFNLKEKKLYFFYFKLIRCKKLLSLNNLFNLKKLKFLLLEVIN